MIKRTWLGRTAGVFLALLVLGVGLFVAGYVITLGDYRVEKTVAEDPSLPFIEIDGYRFHGQTFGDPAAPVLIVVHGGPGWDYRSLLPLKALADEHFVVFFDQRGAGLSPRVPSSQISLDTALQDLDAIVDRFRNNGMVTLVGHSWGAMLVTGYLGYAPEKVRHAVLMEPGFLNSEMFVKSGIRLGPRWEVGYLTFSLRRWFESLHIDGTDPHAPRDYFISEVAARANIEYYCNGEIPYRALQHWRAGAVAMSALFEKLRDGDGGFELDLTAGLERFTGSVLLIAGECNQLIGADQQRRHAGYFTHSRIVVIPDSGHMMMVEKPKTTLAVIRAYMEGLD